MAVATAPSRGSTPPWKGLAALRSAGARLLRPARAPLANVASMPLHVAGLACIDAGVFTATPVAGWIVTGLSLIWLELAIADEP